MSFILTLKEHINESVSNLLQEDKETDNRSRGRKLSSQYIKFDKPGGEQEREVWAKLPVVRKDEYALAPYLYPLYFRDKPNSEECKKINKFLMGSTLTVGVLIDKYNDLETLLEYINGKESDEPVETDEDSQTDEYKYGGYSIVRINNFKEAKKYSHYVDWCVTQASKSFIEYTKNSEQFYFCLERDYKDLEEEPLSMLAVIVNKDGSIKNVVDRDNNGHCMSERELFSLIGNKAKEVLVPLSDKEIANRGNKLRKKIYDLLKEEKYEEIKNISEVEGLYGDSRVLVVRTFDTDLFFDVEKGEYIDNLNGKRFEWTRYMSRNNFIVVGDRNGGGMNIYSLKDEDYIFDIWYKKIGYTKIPKEVYIETNDGNIKIYDLYKMNFTGPKQDYKNIYSMGYDVYMVKYGDAEFNLYSEKEDKLLLPVNYEFVDETYSNHMIGILKGKKKDYYNLRDRVLIDLDKVLNGRDYRMEQDYSNFSNNRTYCLVKISSGGMMFIDEFGRQVGEEFQRIKSWDNKSINPIIITKDGIEKNLLDK